MIAQMVKLVDTPASGAGDLTVVEVRVFFWAPIQISESIWNCTKTRESGFLRFWLPEFPQVLQELVGADECNEAAIS